MGGSAETMKIGEKIDFRNTFKFFGVFLDALSSSDSDEEKENILEHTERVIISHEREKISFETFI